VIGDAVMVAKIATGQIEATGCRSPAKVNAGRSGPIARSKLMTADERSAIARKAAAIGWAMKDQSPGEA